MADPEKMWQEFVEVWDNQEVEEGRTSWAGYYVVGLLVEIHKELQAQRPVELEPVTIESYESRYPGLADGLSRAMVRRFDKEVQRRMAEVHAPGRETDSPHEVRLRQVSRAAVEELNVAPQVAEYARRILMGARPEPDMGIMETLWGYVGKQVVPEGYTLVDKRAAALLELRERATNDGVHPAAAELARRILAGEGPTVTIHHHITGLIQELPLPRLDGGPPTSQAVALDPPRTVLVLEVNVDLEEGDL